MGARGEKGEPNAALDTEMTTCKAWSKGMWAAAAAALKDPSAPAVAWDALWAKHKSEHHDKVTQWDLKKLESKLGKPETVPTILTANSTSSKMAELNFSKLCVLGKVSEPQSCSTPGNDTLLQV